MPAAGAGLLWGKPETLWSQTPRGPLSAEQLSQVLTGRDPGPLDPQGRPSHRVSAETDPGAAQAAVEALLLPGSCWGCTVGAAPGCGRGSGRVGGALTGRRAPGHGGRGVRMEQDPE